MSEEWVKFLIRKVLKEGAAYRVTDFNDQIENREDVDASSLDFWAIKLTKFKRSSVSQLEGIQALVEIVMNDQEGNNYRGHLNIELMDAMEEFSSGFMYDGAELDKLEENLH